MRYLKIILFLFISTFVLGQNQIKLPNCTDCESVQECITEKLICAVGSDPNLISNIDSINLMINCGNVYDTTNNVHYYYDAAFPVGERWRTDILVKRYPLTSGFNKMSQLLKNDQVVNFLMLGDSKTDSGKRGANKLAELMYQEWGFAGSGYLGFGSQPPLGFNRSYVGGTIVDNDNRSLDRYSYQMTGSNLITYNAIGTHYNTNNQLILYYLEHTGGGDIQVQFGGTTQIVNTNGISNEKKSVIISTTTGINDLIITNISGINILFEGILKNTEKTSGIIFYKAGNSGTFTPEYDTVFQDPINQQQIIDLGIDHAMIRLGINDAGAGVYPYNTYISLKSIITNIGVESSIIGIENILNVGIYGFERYRQEQQRVSNETGSSYISLVSLIGDWSDWTNLGYAQDIVHSNEDGGDLIGEFLFTQMLSSDLQANPSRISSNANYDFSYPNLTNNSYELGFWTHDFLSGTEYNATGFTNDLLFNLGGNNKAIFNASGSMGGFEINGNVPIKLGESLLLTPAGGLEFDNTALEGDVLWTLDSNNDFRINLTGGGSGDFTLMWNTTMLLEAFFNKVTLGVPLYLNNVSGTSTDYSQGLLFRSNNTNRVHQLGWTDIRNQVNGNNSGAGSPIGIITPSTKFELYHNTSDNSIWMSYGTGVNEWKQISL